MSKYLLIGGGGFIGVNLSTYLKGNGHQVSIFHHNDDLNELSSLVDKSDLFFYWLGLIDWNKEVLVIIKPLLNQ